MGGLACGIYSSLVSNRANCRMPAHTRPHRGRTSTAPAFTSPLRGGQRRLFAKEGALGGGTILAKSEGALPLAWQLQTNESIAPSPSPHPPPSAPAFPSRGGEARAAELLVNPGTWRGDAVGVLRP
jgi:hypothetical protein